MTDGTGNSLRTLRKKRPVASTITALLAMSRLIARGTLITHSGSHVLPFNKSTCPYTKVAPSPSHDLPRFTIHLFSLPRRK